MQSYDVLIVGSGHGGAQAAIALRQGKFDGTVGIVTEEADLPYERPPLSKEYLAGEKSFERMLIRKADFWDERGIEIVTSRRVVGIEPVEKAVRTSDGGALRYDKLVWAAGGRPRLLTCSGHDLRGVHTVRTRKDVDAMIAELPSVSRAVVIGGGYIGLEAAAALRKADKQVVLLEALERVLARVAGEDLSRFYEDEHRRQGVDVRLNAAVTCIQGEAGKVTGVELAKGEVLPCEMVVVGIGITPEIGPLRDAGAVCGNGVRVDAQCRTSLPDVYAVGDCALHANRYAAGQEVRLESVQNATDQANVAAKAILGGETVYDAVPWFWSDQYDLKLQTVGLSAGHDETVLRGDPSKRSFSIVYLRGGKVIALDCVNKTKDFIQGRKLVTEGLSPKLERLADSGTMLKEFLKAES